MSSKELTNLKSNEPNDQQHCTERQSRCIQEESCKEKAQKDKSSQENNKNYSQPQKANEAKTQKRKIKSKPRREVIDAFNPSSRKTAPQNKTCTISYKRTSNPIIIVRPTHK